MASEARKRASRKFDQKHARTISVKLYDTVDSDILERLAQCESIQGYIKELIRKDIFIDKAAGLIERDYGDTLRKLSET